MPYSPVLIVHICAGTLGLLSGTAAMSFRKGSPRHVLAGKVFVDYADFLASPSALHESLQRQADASRVDLHDS